MLRQGARRPLAPRPLHPPWRSAAPRTSRDEGDNEMNDGELHQRSFGFLSTTIHFCNCSQALADDVWAPNRLTPVSQLQGAGLSSRAPLHICQSTRKTPDKAAHASYRSLRAGGDDRRHGKSRPRARERNPHASKPRAVLPGLRAGPSGVQPMGPKPGWAGRHRGDRPSAAAPEPNLRVSRLDISRMSGAFTATKAATSRSLPSA